MWMHYLLSTILFLSSVMNLFASHSGSEFQDRSFSEEFQEVFPKTRAEEFVDSKVLEIIQEYVVPEKHHTKIALDRIFSQRGVLASIKSMEDAGFQIICHRKGRGLVVASHPYLKNYLIKTYLDSASHVDWTSWVRRVKGALVVQQVINKKPRYQRYIKVPQKWIYHIPEKGRGKIEGENFPREFLLIVKDMKIVGKEENAWLFLSHFSKASLDALYYVITESGYSDCHIGNVPFSIDGKIALIDTEHAGRWPVHPEWLTKWFSPEKQIQWEAFFR